MARLTAEQACINYALAQSRVNALTDAIGRLMCQRQQDFHKRNEEDSPNAIQTYELPKACLDDYFLAAKETGDVEDMELCDACEQKLRLIEARKPEKLRFGAAKRTVAAIGKRLNAEVR